MRPAGMWLAPAAQLAYLPQAAYNQGVALFEQGLITAALPK